MKEQIKGVDVAQSKAIELFWSGVAEVSNKESIFFFDHVSMHYNLFKISNIGWFRVYK